MNSTDQTFSETMRRIRKAQGMTLADIAKRSGLPLQRLRDVDSGKFAPYLREALCIADALGTTVDALARGHITQHMLGIFRDIARTLPKNDSQSLNDKGENNETHR